MTLIKDHLWRYEQSHIRFRCALPWSRDNTLQARRSDLAAKVDASKKKPAACKDTAFTPPSVSKHSMTDMREVGASPQTRRGRSVFHRAMKAKKAAVR